MTEKSIKNPKIVGVYKGYGNNLTLNDLNPYLDVNGIFKYVIFRICGNQKNHLLRFGKGKEEKEIKYDNAKKYVNPLPDYFDLTGQKRLEKKLIEVGEYTTHFVGDTHLNIIGKLIKEFTKERDLNINEIDFTQDDGHGLLWIIRESEKKQNCIAGLCAEGGAYMKIEEGDIYLYGDSQALQGGKINYSCRENEKEVNLIRVWDYLKNNPEKTKGKENIAINPLYGIPAITLQEKTQAERIFVPNLNGENVEFNLGKIMDFIKK
ncbi:MAG: hypothetical protein KJ949_02185 [Nanoarchaeota archaeon]|nr:hypothetical protein [Nanoarchaeota archaeon]